MTFVPYTSPISLALPLPKRDPKTTGRSVPTNKERLATGEPFLLLTERTTTMPQDPARRGNPFAPGSRPGSANVVKFVNFAPHFKTNNFQLVPPENATTSPKQEQRRPATRLPRSVPRSGTRPRCRTRQQKGPFIFNGLPHPPLEGGRGVSLTPAGSQCPSPTPKRETASPEAGHSAPPAARSLNLGSATGYRPQATGCLLTPGPA